MFYLMEVTEYVDGTEKAKAVYEYEDETLAVGNFHTKLGGAMKNENYASELLIVTDDKSNIIKKDVFVRPAQPQPEPEVVEGE